jgi:tRNA U38,U39,U40 pseudouridine synthase TruA
VIIISRYRQRHIALHLQYDGAKYLGFAWSDDGETVESHLFNALTKLRLIESREVSEYIIFLSLLIFT